MRDARPTRLAGGEEAIASADGRGLEEAIASSDGRGLVLRFPVQIGALAWVQRQAAEFLRGQGVADRLVGRAELLLEELVTNVINHGGVTDLMARFVVTLAVEPNGGCRIVFEDPGRPFDPAAAVLPDRPTRLEEARIGGLGLVLLRQMADDLRHEARPGGGNRLSFRLEAGG